MLNLYCLRRLSQAFYGSCTQCLSFFRLALLSTTPIHLFTPSNLQHHLPRSLQGKQPSTYFTRLHLAQSTQKYILIYFDVLIPFEAKCCLLS